MANVESIIRKHLQSGRMMQLATVNGDQPWCCTVYFVPDENLNLYWISTPERRHSQEIHRHGKAAAAIPITYLPNDGDFVVGVSVEGHASLVEDPNEITTAMKLYADRYGNDEVWIQDFLAGKNPHKPYKLKPSLFVLFDSKEFPNDTRQEWRP